MTEDKFVMQMKLVEMMLDNCTMTKQEMWEAVGLFRRTFYRYLEEFKRAGFHIDETQTHASILPSSPFIEQLTNHVRLTQSEVSTICSLLEQADARLANVSNLKNKMRSVYGVSFSTDVQMDKLMAKNTELLRQAIEKKRKVLLPSYFSPHSQTTSDRVVEPYKFLLNNLEIRCYEDASDKCKTFKISRIQKTVQLLSEKWEHEKQHTNLYTDLWGFSDETTKRVKLKLGYLSARLLMEEYRVPDYQLIILDDKHWLFATQVCSFQGIGRFYMGLCNDIEIVDSPEFQEYIDGILENLTKNRQNTPVLDEKK